MSLAEELLRIAVPTESVTVLGREFIVTGKSLNDKAALLASCRRKDGTLNGDKFDRLILTECVVVAQDKSTLTPEQWGSVSSHITAPLVSSAISILGFDEDDIQRVRQDPKNSGSTES